MFDDSAAVATYDIVMPPDLSMKTLLEVCDFDHITDGLVGEGFPLVIRGTKELTVYLYPIDASVPQTALDKELQKRGLRMLEIVETLVLVAKFDKLPERGAPIVVPSLCAPSGVPEHRTVACVKRATSNDERWLVKENMGPSVALKFLLPVTHHR